MGRLKVVPDLSIAEVEPDRVSALILPGGDTWMEGEISDVTNLVKRIFHSGKPVAAICAQTLALAHVRLLEDHRHTSNGSRLIPKYVPKHRGHALYQRIPDVADGNVITATGLAPFAFAAEIF